MDIFMHYLNGPDVKALALTDDEIAPDIRDAEANPQVRDTTKYECAA